MVRRPNVSEKDDHQRGNIDMLSIYNATLRFVSVGEALNSLEIWPSAAGEGIRTVYFYIPGRNMRQALSKFKWAKRSGLRKNIALPKGAAAAAKATIRVISHFVLFA
jgi:hypothetical protein